MALTQRLDLRQTQALVMTPQLQQAIKLLQLSNLELAEYVDQEMERNPLLEREEAEPGSDAGESGTAADDIADAPDPDMIGTDQHAQAPGMADGDSAPLDTDYENVWTGGGPGDPDGWAGVAGVARTGGGQDFDGDGAPAIDQTLSSEASLRDLLTRQIALTFPDPGERLIGLQLLEWLDDSGYLTADLDALAEQMGADRARLDRIVSRLQGLEPTGIFARSLAECLALQLAEKNRLDPAMQAMLDNLGLLAKRELAPLMRICGVDADDLADMIEEIRHLDPRPARAFDHEPIQAITPDILMRPQAGGGWFIELNPDTLPRVLVNQRYYAEISQAARNKEEREYLAECFATANWLVKSLHQRATTILKVASEIVRQQDAFFVHGVSRLKPLILRDIAEAIGMHESTVSRVTSNKFIATPRGLFELKYFFTSAIQGADGAAAHSAEAVRFRIRALIDGEAPEAILSDDKIVEILRTDGIDIARRTVAKYREGMRIPSSVQRRREKALRA
ncbi:MAG: RNA polymerase factor sigma-54 [Azospirillaceae bacterium]